jgi:tetratricopeptide (TPR) repeat protein
MGDESWEGAGPATTSGDEPWEPEVWVEDVDDAPAEGRPGTRFRDRWAVPENVAQELASAAGTRNADRLAARLRDGVRAFERDHFRDAKAILQPLADEAPGSASVHELLGLTYYRLGQWAQAARELEAYAEISRSTTSHPVLADALRALGRHTRVTELWDELKAASPDGATVAEGRIVMAGSLADRGDVAGAIALLEAGKLAAKQPSDHHLRLWYALADLYERAGEVPRARELFGRIARHDPDFVDAADRRRALG